MLFMIPRMISFLQGDIICQSIAGFAHLEAPCLTCIGIGFGQIEDSDVLYQPSHFVDLEIVYIRILFWCIKST